MYSATLTSDYYWDGITFALQIEKVAKAERGAELLFHPNHLIYNGSGYVLYRTTQALGFSIRALQVLQIANAIAGAMGASVSTTAALAIATLVFFNLSLFVLPHMKANANPRIAAARQANQVWNEATVIYFADRNEADTAFEYFNDKTDWRRLTPTMNANFDDEVRLALGQGKQVWLNKGAVDVLNSEWLARRSHGREILLEEPQAPAHYIELR